MTEALWTANEIAAVTKGRLHGSDFSVTGISTDTRSVQPGDLFIALKGPQFDGNDYIEQALEKGAAGVLTEKTLGDKCITVEDTLRALQDLGSGARARSAATIIAVTGSVGKTSVKSMLAAAFSTLGKTHAAEASLNNHWGVPLSLARLPVSAQYAVFEIGMNHANEISPLSKLVAPHISVITTIAAAHIEYLGSIENITLAKAEIFHGMDANGTAILPRDSEQFSILLAEARTQGLQHILSFGEHPEADIRLVSLKAETDHSEIVAAVQGTEIAFNLGVPGRHHAVNTLSVLGALQAVKAPLGKALPAFDAMRPVSGRGDRIEIVLTQGNAPLVVIDETHNASPVAVEAALILFSQSKATGRRIVVLGDMRELGTDSPQLHAGLAGTVQNSGADLVLLSGPMMAYLAEKLDGAHHFADSAALADKLKTIVKPGDTVLVKGSRGSKMKLVVDALEQMGQRKTQQENHRKLVETPVT